MKCSQPGITGTIGPAGARSAACARGGTGSAEAATLEVRVACVDVATSSMQCTDGKFPATGGERIGGPMPAPE